MCRILKIWSVFILLTGIHTPALCHDILKNTTLDFYGQPVTLPLNSTEFVDFDNRLSEAAVLKFYNEMEAGHYEATIETLIQYRESEKPDDWIYYQLIRKTAETISPKRENYNRYTLYKWYFLLKSGYDATLSIAGDTILFYVQSDENIYDIPYYMSNGKQYVCLNYHDYGYSLDLKGLSLKKIAMDNSAAKSFSYKLTHIPQFKPSDYKYKDIRFAYQDASYHFQVKVNNEVKSLYANYPVADYQLYFNVPMSRETYNSFIPKLKEITSRMNMGNGIDYLMRFTRYAFNYQTDNNNFGKEKRLSPEQTLLYESSDCEDRAALFFFLVKELYNLPMIVLAYPSHVTVAVKLDKGRGKPIVYNGEKYYICEPTPQYRDLGIGQVSRELQQEAFEVAYAYHP